MRNRELLPGMVKISDLGVDIESVRKSAKLSKDAMAIKCGVSGLTYQRWSTGVTKSMTQENFDNVKRVIKELEAADANA